MNTLTYLIKNLPIPFYVTDGKEFFKVMCSDIKGMDSKGAVYFNGVITLKQKVLWNGKFQTIPGGWVIDISECRERKWKLFSFFELTPAQKYILENEPLRNEDVVEFLDLDKCEQTEMIF